MTKKQLENKYILARRAFESENFDEAYSYYRDILCEEPNDFEAAFRAIISKVYISNLASFKTTTHSLQFEVAKLFELDSVTDLSASEQVTLARNAEREFTAAIITMEKAATAHFNEFSSLPNSMSEYRSQLLNLYFACGGFGKAIYNTFKHNKDAQRHCANPLKNALILLKKSATGLGPSVLRTCFSDICDYGSKIKEFEPDYVNPCLQALQGASNSSSSNNSSSGNQSSKLTGTGIVCLILSIIGLIIGISLWSGDESFTSVAWGVALTIISGLVLLVVPTMTKSA